MLVIGYHGCDQTTCDALVAGSTQLRPSCNPYDWLGDGIYFFEADWRRALKFAIASCERPYDKLTREPVRLTAVSSSPSTSKRTEGTATGFFADSIDGYSTRFTRIEPRPT